jgi:hypothetical protein
VLQSLVTLPSSLFPLPQLNLEHVQRAGLTWSTGYARNLLPHKGIEETRFSDVGTAEERDFGEREGERDVGPRKGADEGGTCQASFF